MIAFLNMAGLRGLPIARKTWFLGVSGGCFQKGLAFNSAEQTKTPLHLWRD